MAPVSFHGLHAQTAVMRDVFRRITRIAATDLPLLLIGESGSGKAQAALALHAESERRDQPFVTVNCAAFTDDFADTIASAAGGTLFLREVGDLSLAAQGNMWQALETMEAQAMREPLFIGRAVRIVSSSSQPLEALVAQGKLREDLLYRLQVASLTMPTLRERIGDLAVIAAHFLSVFSERYQLPLRTIDTAAFNLLLRYDWPGNVRELRNVIESAVVLSESTTLMPRDLPSALTARPHTTINNSLLMAQSTDMPFTEARERALREFDRAYLGEALARHGGNVARTARALGLHRQSLQKLLVRRELRPPGEATHDL